MRNQKESPKVKVKFLKNYSPRKAGEVVDLDKKVADFYLSLVGIAKLACEDCTEGVGKPCKGCEEHADAQKKNKATIGPGSQKEQGHASGQKVPAGTVVKKKTVKEIEAEMDAAQTVDEVIEIAGDDTRPGVLAAKDIRIAEIEDAAKGKDEE